MVLNKILKLFGLMLIKTPEQKEQADETNVPVVAKPLLPKKKEIEIPEKDPNDHRCGGNNCSKEWTVVDFSCSTCLQDLTRAEWFANTCNHCGSYVSGRWDKMWRKIFYQGKWQYQIRRRPSHGFGKTKEVISETYIG